MKPEVEDFIESIMAPLPKTMPCILCGTFTRLTEREQAVVAAGHTPVKVCKECKSAIAYVKKKMKNSE